MFVAARDALAQSVRSTNEALAAKRWTTDQRIVLETSVEKERMLENLSLSTLMWHSVLNSIRPFNHVPQFRYKTEMPKIKSNQSDLNLINTYRYVCQSVQTIIEPTHRFGYNSRRTIKNLGSRILNPADKSYYYSPFMEQMTFSVLYIGKRGISQKILSSVPIQWGMEKKKHLGLDWEILPPLPHTDYSGQEEGHLCSWLCSGRTWVWRS